MSDMQQKNWNEPHDLVVREYLSAELDGQVGKAEARFRQMLSQQQPPAPVHRNRFRFPHRFEGWTMGLIGTALAASLAALWAGPSLRQVTPEHHDVTAPIHTTPVNGVLVEQDVQSQTFDDGTFMADDNTAVRVVRRRDLQRTRWFDQDKNLQGEEVVPQDHVVYVHVKTY